MLSYECLLTFVPLCSEGIDRRYDVKTNLVQSLIGDFSRENTFRSLKREGYDIVGALSALSLIGLKTLINCGFPIGSGHLVLV